MNRLVKLVGTFGAAVVVFIMLSIMYTKELSLYSLVVSPHYAFGIVGTAYGLYLAWGGAMVARTSSISTPTATPSTTADVGEYSPNVRKIVPSCNLYKHPHVHTIYGSGKEVCQEKAAFGRIPKFKIAKLPSLSTGGGISPQGIGHYRALVVLTFAAFVTYAFSYFSGLYYSTLVSQIAFLPYIVVAFAGCQAIWSDAKAIDEAVGTKEISAGWWSLFGLLVTFIAVPLYTFEWRANVLKRIQPMPPESGAV